MKNLLFLSILLVLSLGFSSCIKHDVHIPRTDQTIEHGAYYFEIEGGPCESQVFEGDEVENTDWDPTISLIYLENDPDYDSKQIMTLYLYYEEIYGEYEAHSNAPCKLATSCISFGPGNEAKPRLYNPSYSNSSHRIDSITIGTNFISGKIVNWKFDRLLVYPEDEPEQITVNGHFVAKVR